jgi:hypothetical protein
MLALEVLPFFGIEILSNKQLDVLEAKEKIKIERFVSIHKNKQEEKQAQHEYQLEKKKKKKKKQYDEHIARQLKRERKQQRESRKREYIIMQKIEIKN